MAVASLPDFPIVGGFVKPKRVKKGIVKPTSPEKGLKMAKTLLNTPTSPKKALTNEIIQAAAIETIASTIAENVPIKVKISKPRSKKGKKTPIVEQIDPTSRNIEPVFASTAANKGINDAIVVDNSPAEPILEQKGIDNVLINAPKTRVGRPRGCLDKVKRQPKGDNKLGRPFGSKDAGPRKRRSTRKNVNKPKVDA